MSRRGKRSRQSYTKHLTVEQFTVAYNEEVWWKASDIFREKFYYGDFEYWNLPDLKECFKIVFQKEPLPIHPMYLWRAILYKIQKNWRREPKDNKKAHWYHSQFWSKSNERSLRAALAGDWNLAPKKHRKLWREMLEELTLKEQENTMSKSKNSKKRSSKKNGRKPTASNFLYQTFWGNNQTRLTDKKIQSMTIKKFGPSPSLERMGNISRMRRRLNAGKIAEFGVPKHPIKNWDAHGKEVVPGAKKSKKSKRVITDTRKTKRVRKGRVPKGATPKGATRRRTGRRSRED